MSRPAPLFERTAVLKSDVFSVVERGIVRTAAGPVAAVRRDIAVARWWAMPLAMHLHWREARALRRLGPIPGVPPLIHADRRTLLRGWIEGLPLPLAPPRGNDRFFDTAMALVLALHRSGVVHNDLAKEANWLVLPDGSAGVTDFQLASLHPLRGPLFRLLAREDVRHMLKHKRKLHPAALTADERRLVERRSLPFRVARAIKPAYTLVTHGLLRQRDREGGGDRLSVDAPKLEAALGRHPAVREASVVSFHNRGAAIGLHAYVECTGPTEPAALLSFLSSQAGTPAAPERLEVVASLPRDAQGRVMSEILLLIARDQTDQLEPLLAGDPERRAAVHAILALTGEPPPLEGGKRGGASRASARV